MGAYRSLYSGPFLQVRVPTKMETPDRCRNRSECPNTDSKEGFCNKCGIRLAERFGKPRLVIEKRPDEVVESECEAERLSYWSDGEGEKGLYWAIPNVAYAGEPLADHSWSVSEMRQGPLNISGRSQDVETSAFQAAFADEIQLLKDAFGVDAVQVLWDVLFQVW